MIDYKTLYIEEHTIVTDIDKKKLFNKDSIIFDCGACVGDFTFPLYNLYKCNFYLYEPDSRNHRRLCRRFKDIPKIRIQNKAIDEEIATKEFYLGRFITASSLFQSHRGLGNNIIEVKTTTLEKEMKEFDKIDLLKLDLEGSEIDVILGMDKKLLKKILQINVEYHLQAEIDGYIKEMVNQCRYYLKDNGFEEIIYNDTKYNAGQDACYLNRRLICK